jgi:DNA-binding CsgD family transcriptional regulator
MGGSAAVRLLGRDEECARIDALIDRVHTRRGDNLVVRGEPGIGKTALLDYAAARGGSATVLRATGRQSELELAYASLLELLRPEAGRISELPAPQADVLRAALGMGGETPERFRAYAATLAFLASAAEANPHLLLLDDVQWFDEASLQALLFATRRLAQDAVGVVFAVRDDESAPRLEGIEELHLEGLDPKAATALLDQVAPDLDTAVQARLAEETGGNPLALVELPGLLDQAQRTGRSPLPKPLRGGHAAAHLFAERIARLPDDTRLALVGAAASDADDLGMLGAVLSALGLDVAVLGPAEEAGLLGVADGRFSFRHPLARSAAYESASPDTRRLAHRAQAVALEGTSALDARIWHQALGAERPDEALASELLASGTRMASASMAAGAARFEFAARLTPDPGRRAERMVAAADATRMAGRAESAMTLSNGAIELTQDPVLAAQAQRVIALVEGWNRGAGAAAAERLVSAARTIESTDPDLAANLCAESVELWWAAGEIQRAYDVMTWAWSLGWTRGGATELHAALRYADTRSKAGEFREARRTYSHAAALFAEPLPDVDAVIRYELQDALFMLDEDERAMAIVVAGIEQAREQSALAMLPTSLELLAMLEARAGRLADAAAAASEGLALAQSLEDGHETLHMLGTLAWVEAMLGLERDCRSHIAHGEEYLAVLGPNELFDRSGLGLLELSLGRVELAADVLESVARQHRGWASDAWPRPYLANLIEAKVRGGRRAEAERDLEVVQDQAERSERPIFLATAARCRGLLVADSEVDEVFSFALGWHTRAGNPFEEARTRLCYGERLRRAKRQRDARAQLGHALQGFEKTGAAIFAERTRDELALLGDRPRRPVGDALSPQELQVASLVAQGMRNREVAARLFLSPKTIETHLAHVFRKMRVKSRTELAVTLSRGPGSG